MKSEEVRFASGMNIALALWLIASPFILGYAGIATALWDAVIVGVVVLALACIRMARPAGSPWASWIILLLAGWLAVSPLALGLTYASAAMWNDITVGLSIVLFTLVSVMAAYLPSS